MLDEQQVLKIITEHKSYMDKFHEIYPFTFKPKPEQYYFGGFDGFDSKKNSYDMPDITMNIYNWNDHKWTLFGLVNNLTLTDINNVVPIYQFSFETGKYGFMSKTVYDENIQNALYDGYDLSDTDNGFEIIIFKNDGLITSGRAVTDHSLYFLTLNNSFTGFIILPTHELYDNLKVYKIIKLF